MPARTTAASEKMHRDHVRVDRENALWRSLLLKWQQEQSIMLKTVDELKDLIEKEKEQIAAELDRIFDSDYQTSVHESLDRAAYCPPEQLTWLERRHRELAASHVAQKKSIAKLGERHELARVVLDELLEMLQDEGER